MIPFNDWHLGGSANALPRSNQYTQPFRPPYSSQSEPFVKIYKYTNKVVNMSYSLTVLLILLLDYWAWLIIMC